MKFKEWLNALLVEFNKTNLYDFYALELGKNQVKSHGDSLQDKEIDAKIIEKGNDLLRDISDSLELILFDRFVPEIFHLYTVNRHKTYGDFEDYIRDEAPEFANKLMKYFPVYVNKQSRQRFYDDIVSHRAFVEKFYELSREERHEALVNVYEFLTSREYRPVGVGGWNDIYNLYVNNWTDEIATSAKQIIKKIDSLLQVVHNSGSILQYMPPELDKGLQYRDNVTHLNQLLRYASSDVRELLRSAAMSGKTTAENVNYGQMFLTAVRRAEKSPFFLRQTSIGNEYIPHNITLKSFNNDIAIYEVDTVLPNGKNLKFDIRCIFYKFDKKHKGIKAQVLRKSIQFKNLDEYIANYKKTKLYAITKTEIPGMTFESQGEFYWGYTDYHELAVGFLAWLVRFIYFFRNN